MSMQICNSSLVAPFELNHSFRYVRIVSGVPTRSVLFANVNKRLCIQFNYTFVVPPTIVLLGLSQLFVLSAYILFISGGIFLEWYSS